MTQDFSVPDEELDKLYKKGGHIWRIKNFQATYLAALVHDLNLHRKNGISPEACHELTSALGDAIVIVADIQDGDFIYASFANVLTDFKKTYEEWNNAEKQIERMKLREKLIEHRVNISKSVYRSVKKIKTGSPAELEFSLQYLKKADNEKINKMKEVFNELINTHKDLFPSLQKTLISN